MSTPEDKAACQARDAWGNPIQIFGPHSRGNYSHQDDHSNNKALPWAVLAALFGGLGFGGLVVLCLLKPWETSDRAVQAELRAEFGQDIADIRAEARNASGISEVWRNRVNKLEAEANANRRR
jgi:hypothetical protein